MDGMTPNAADIAAAPVPLPDCRFCGAVGVPSLMSKWGGVFRTIFLHPVYISKHNINFNL
jgi:hypothetical protein